MGGRFVGVGCASLLGMSIFLGCSKVEKVVPPPMLISVGNVATTTNGATVVHLTITNYTGVEVWIRARSIIYQSDGFWTTNRSWRPNFVATLAADEGVALKFPPVLMNQPFQMEFVCSLERVGVRGLVDRAQARYKAFWRGSRSRSYLGGDLLVATAVIHPKLETEGEATAGSPGQ